ncbi:MAG TPA: ABC transporter ATP-binding protein [Ruminiclostridium sp.]|nr:ABC transporter ATP-binding protein [Ruminiclostridium sp.]
MSENKSRDKKGNSLLKDLAITLQAMKTYHKVDKVLIPVIVIRSILNGIQPFILIFLAGLLLDSLYEGKDVQLMVSYAIAGVGIKLIFAVFDSYLGKTFYTKSRNIHNYQGIQLSEKLMYMDYEYIECEEIQNIVRRQKEYSQAYGGVYFVLFNRLDAVLTRFVTILISIFLVIPLFLKTGHAATGMERVINSPLFPAGFIVLISAGLYVSIRSTKNMQEVEVKNKKQLLDINRNFFYYISHFLDGYEKGKDVRLFNMKGLISEESDKLVNQTIQHGKWMEKVKWRFELVNQPISTLTGGLVYLFVSLRSIIGAITIGNVVNYSGCILQFINSFSQFLSNLSGLRANNQYVEELLAFLALNPKKRSGTIPVEKRRDNRFVIEFRHVFFRYPGTKEYVIEDMNVTFDIGERMAVVGRNGSGKTTFIKLLCRLYEPTRGQILLNGIDISKYDYEEYLKLFAVVFQDSKIHSFSVGNNVAASEEVDEERVKEALIRAGLGSLLEKMPQGIHTYVRKDFDKEGIEISGGEAQRMEIARAIYQDRPFVIMDEPTAALDPIAEYEVYSGFNAMVGNKTAIYISHRLSSCRFCNDIVVFDNGKVIQRGNHSSLINEKGLYEKMWNAQAQYYADTSNAVVFQG